jgi:hypothetical protein
MSRTAGPLQLEIWRATPTDGSWTTLRKIVWRLATARPEEGIDEDRLSSTFYKKCWRATRTLDERLPDKVETRKRKLESVDELARFFPYQASDVEVVEARERLLPSLMEIATQADTGRFDGLKQENHILTSLYGWPRTPVRQKLANAWTVVEGVLLQELARSEPGPDREAWWAAASQARHLYMGIGEAASPRSLLDLVSECPDSTQSAIDAKERAARFHGRVFPSELRMYTGLKGTIYRVADFESARPTLLAWAKALLLDRHEGYVRGLPGYGPPRERTKKRTWRDVGFSLEPPVVYPPVLDQLLDKRALHKLMWLRRRGSQSD